jgi:hypothetical protein
MFDYKLELDRSRQEREREAAAWSQRAQVKSPSIRRAMGRSIMSIGARLAAEPQTSRSQTESSLALARSR